MNDDNRSENVVLVVLIGFLGIAVWLCVTGLAIIYAQENNQIVRPLPGGPDAPVVPEIPSLVSELSSRKARCEGYKAKFGTLIQQGQVHRSNLAKGQKLYTDAKAAQDELISFLQTGLARRFRAGDENTVSLLLANSKEKTDAFLNWVNSLDRPPIGAITEDWSAIMNAWLDRVSRENEAAIKMIRDDLEKCRMERW
ncbi:MAG: hypothetical protein K2X81_23090 [Candidatus Obscuribacterales bacterium]|nr:hypothetical protein [Candidatus Obscuribacterales bacterium]